MPKEIDFKKLTEVIKNELKEQGIEFVDPETRLTTEFERNYAYMRYGRSCVDDYLDEEHIKTIKEEAKKILEFARLELQPEIDSELSRAYQNQDQIVYQRGMQKGREEGFAENFESLISKVDVEELVEEKKDSLDLDKHAYYAFGAYRDGVEDVLKALKEMIKK